MGLLAGLPRKNCWTIAEHAGDCTPDGMQHLLARAKWESPGPIAYLSQVAVSTAARAYKQPLLDALGPQPGHVILDVGCGAGADLPGLAAAVAPPKPAGAPVT